MPSTNQTNALLWYIESAFNRCWTPVDAARFANRPTRPERPGQRWRGQGAVGAGDPVVASLTRPSSLDGECVTRRHHEYQDLFQARAARVSSVQGPATDYWRLFHLEGWES